ncbi:hypothetical protein VP01_4589g1 [Puccinia sorghi]|uniref:Uncharacterized protein n=1 Tax=Puccinia sorghi TaxID=27349 RepID=A0A0L6UNK3_9BASI|nr:hypothetical protein VP01_4589g1 [Puccinia sorghi]
MSYYYQNQFNPTNGNPNFFQLQTAESNNHPSHPDSNVRHDLVGSLPPALVSSINIIKFTDSFRPTQMNHMHAVHQVEGFFFLASTDVEETVFKVGGSVLGEIYIQLLRKRNNPWKQFCVWASGVAVHARLSGLPVGPPKIGSRKHEAQGPWYLLDVHKN